jgi:hypothetical protein
MLPHPNTAYFTRSGDSFRAGSGMYERVQRGRILRLFHRVPERCTDFRKFERFIPVHVHLSGSIRGLVA